jgi:hypothetical protein
MELLHALWDHNISTCSSCIHLAFDFFTGQREKPEFVAGTFEAAACHSVLSKISRLLHRGGEIVLCSKREFHTEGDEQAGTPRD